MQNKFSLTTADVARMAGTTIPAIQRQVQRTGAWRGVRPNRTNRKFLWPRIETMAAAGLMPDTLDAGHQIAVRFLAGTIDPFGHVPLDPVLVRVGMAMASTDRVMYAPEAELIALCDALERWVLRARNQNAAPHPAMGAAPGLLHSLAEEIESLMAGGAK